MRRRTLSVYVLILFLGFVIGSKPTVESEPDNGDPEESSCQGQEQLNIQSDEVVFNETSSGEGKPSDVEDVSAKANTTIDSDVGRSNSSNVNNSTFLVSCILNKTYAGLPVEIVNATKLALLLQVDANVTNRQVPANCVAVFFYTPSCPFSCMAAPHFNALPRLYPDIKMVAVDSMKHRGFNAQFGIVGTPTFMLFHGGRPAAKLNDTSKYILDGFVVFLTKYTGIAPAGKIGVTVADFAGPLPSTPVQETDYYLILSWMVIAARILYSLYYSTWGKSLVEATLNAWREAEAQHHHHQHVD